ncbi:MAG: glucose-6-phosphate isomerase [Betaproteobacteria bacterium]|nr:glucose-6-phosphate isomerase [Betaproteobacteria bacterium]
MSTLTQTPAWRALQAHALAMRGTNLANLLVGDPDRGERCVVLGADVRLDWSRQKATHETIALLGRLAAQQDWTGWRERLFAGEKINLTEDRAAWHVALRMGAQAPAEVRDALAAARRVATDLRGGRWLGATGKVITHVVNIGIGGSDLGPRMALDALDEYRDTALRFDCVANIDPADLGRVLARCDAERTVFVVASKTFTTQETLVNAVTARTWLHSILPQGSDLGNHFIAVTANLEAAHVFGVPYANILPTWDWVGGRYSIWSCVGITLMLAIGPEQFDAFLSGAAEADAHFTSAPFAQNIPALMALLGIWHINFHASQTHAVLPYAQPLAQFPSYLQQLEMESNGKSVDRAGGALDYASAPILWGAAGTVGQHSFHQLLHQGTLNVPVDFIVVRESRYDPARHAILIANALAQAQALAFGRQDASLASYRRYPGDRSSSMLTLERLDPRNLGRLIALYEHKVFVQGVVWDIDSFDQWGVEYGKQLAAQTLAQRDNTRN